MVSWEENCFYCAMFLIFIQVYPVQSVQFFCEVNFRIAHFSLSFLKSWQKYHLWLQGWRPSLCAGESNAELVVCRTQRQDRILSSAIRASSKSAAISVSSNSTFSRQLGWCWNSSPYRSGANLFINVKWIFVWRRSVTRCSNKV